MTAVKQRVRRLFLFSAVAGALTFAGLCVVAPRYQSEAVLMRSDTANVTTRVAEAAPDEGMLPRLQTDLQSAEVGPLQSQQKLDRAMADSPAGSIEAETAIRAPTASTPGMSKVMLAALAALAILLLGLAFTIIRAFFEGTKLLPDEAAGASLNGNRETREPILDGPPLLALQRLKVRPRDEIAVEVADAGTVPAPSTSAPSTDERAHPALEPVSLTDADVIRVSTIGALARRICTQAVGSGYRTLVAGETDMMGISSHAIELAKALTEFGQSVILLDWAPEGDGIAHALSLPSGPGVAELLNGAATFEQIIRRIPGSEAHVIGAGAFEKGDTSSLDPDRLNLVLDALDEVYDQVIVAARNEPARNFFEVIEGRIDCGVLVADPCRVGSVLRDPPGSYLGFEVAEIDLVRYDRQVVASTSQRIVRTGRGTPAVAAS